MKNKEKEMWNTYWMSEKTFMKWTDAFKKNPKIGMVNHTNLKKKQKLNSIMIIFSNKAISLTKIMSFEELMNNVTVDAIS